MERVALTGSHGFLGRRLATILEHPIKLGRDGNIPDCEIVFDCAAFGNLASQRKDAIEIYKANLMRVITSVEQLKPHQKFIYVSSSSVARPKQNLYSLSKKAAEDYLRLQVENHNKKIAIARPYAITGAGEQEEHLIPTLIRSCLYGKKMPFVPEPHHDFIDVEDVANALLLIAKKGKLKGEYYDIGVGISFSNDTVRKVVELETGRKANIRKVKSMRDYDSKDWRADPRELEKLGWTPKKSLMDSIIEMVEYEKQNTRGV